VNVHQSNLLFALRIAIADQRKIEKAAGYTMDSIFVGGLEEVYEHIKQGGQIHIVPSI